MLLGKTTLDTKQRIDHVYSQHADIITALRKRDGTLLRECDEEPHGNIADA